MFFRNYQIVKRITQGIHKNCYFSLKLVHCQIVLMLKCHKTDGTLPLPQLQLGLQYARPLHAIGNWKNQLVIMDKIFQILTSESLTEMHGLLTLTGNNPFTHQMMKRLEISSKGIEWISIEFPLTIFALSLHRCLRYLVSAGPLSSSL